MCMSELTLHDLVDVVSRPASHLWLLHYKMSTENEKYKKITNHCCNDPSDPRQVLSPGLGTQTIQIKPCQIIS